MKTNTILVLAFTAILNLQTQSQVTYTKIISDQAGDEFIPTLLDATNFYYGTNASKDSLFFRFEVSSLSGSQSAAIGLNVMFNIPGGGNTFNFWGHDNLEKYHKLVTVWVTGTPPSNYSGTIGIADATGVNNKNYTNLISGQLGMNVSPSDKMIIIGFPRENLISDAEMGGNSIQVGIAAAVGSNTSWNDDIYQAGKKITIEKAASTPVGISSNNSLEDNIGVYPNPFQNNISIANPSGEFLEIEIFDHSGRKLLTDQFRGEKKLSLNQLAVGSYILSIRNEEGETQYQNIIKQ